MMVNVLQEVLLLEREAHRAIWSQTVNWKGEESKNVEADLMQENQNNERQPRSQGLSLPAPKSGERETLGTRLNERKAGIKTMGANKTRKAKKTSTRSSGGKRRIVENIDDISKVASQSGSHTRKSSERDEQLISTDLRKLHPFSNIPGTCHPSFPEQHAHPLEKVDFVELHGWLRSHMQNISNL